MTQMNMSIVHPPMDNAKWEECSKMFKRLLDQPDDKPLHEDFDTQETKTCYAWLYVEIEKQRRLASARAAAHPTKE